MSCQMSMFEMDGWTANDTHTMTNAAHMISLIHNYSYSFPHFWHFSTHNLAPPYFHQQDNFDSSRLPLCLIGCLQPRPIQVDGLYGERPVLLGDHRGHEFQHLRADAAAAGVTCLVGGLLDLCQILCLHEAAGWTRCRVGKSSNFWNPQGSAPPKG